MCHRIAELLRTHKYFPDSFVYEWFSALPFLIERVHDAFCWYSNGQEKDSYVEKKCEKFVKSPQFFGVKPMCSRGTDIDHPLTLRLWTETF